MLAMMSMVDADDVVAAVEFVATNDSVHSYSARYQSNIDTDSRYDCIVDRSISISI